ncbi:MAG: murein biosynthesis integral membrane protein MurJ [Nocardioides sp.]|uniref:murein biosynthesis integral membrane protein MurJ n=1 Tax=Nocardioides sp. TaxID=35761 RepID=UPI0039E4AEB9
MSDQDEQQGILRSSAVMAAGTVVSRLTGFLRAGLLAWALGPLLHADIFNLANTIPNMLYILLAGGIFNAVLVPQLVRAMKHDEDGGDAYTNRVLTLAVLFLGVVTILLVVAAPWVMAPFLGSAWDSLPAQRESVIAFARYCLPQVFFYGMFVLVGQILNARGRFGPMMWAPIANNFISVAVLSAYLVIHGQPADLCGPFTSSQELLLGLGSTLGIAVQFLILLPFLRAAGFRFHPRFDFGDAGLGHTLRLGMWTVLFVVVNQLAYTVVARLAGSGTAQVALDTCSPATQATGYTVYSTAFLIVMVPHSVVTVSLATAILPRLSAHAADQDLSAMGRTLIGALRSVLAVIVPFVALMPIIAPDLANLLLGHGATRESYSLYVPTLSLFGIGLFFFTVHYLMLRGFYAIELTRTVFWIQCVVATTNIVVAVVAVPHVDPVDTAPMLVGAYSAAYAVGASVSFLVLGQRIGRLGDAQLVRYAVRLALAVALTAAAAYLVSRLVHVWLGAHPSWVISTVILAGVSTLGVAIYLGLARLFDLTEVRAIWNMLGGRLLRRAR